MTMVSSNLSLANWNISYPLVTVHDPADSFSAGSGDCDRLQEESKSFTVEASHTTTQYSFLPCLKAVILGLETL